MSITRCKIGAFVTQSNETLCTNWYHLLNLKKRENTHGRVLLLQAESATLLTGTLFHGCFSSFLNCTNGAKLRRRIFLKILIDNLY